MNACKVQKVRIDVEDKLVAEDTKVRVYMSVVRGRSKEARKEERKRRKRANLRAAKWRKHWKWILWKRRMWSRLHHLETLAARILYPALITVGMTISIIYFTYQKRGYMAYGGEWILIFAIFACTIWFVNNFF